ncbi:MAG: hypothetical protein R3C61_20915 [Bacteroidia bacterium]
MRRLLFGIFLLAAHPLSAQYYYNFQQEYFFGNLPNARAEAMGRAATAVGGNVSSQYFNPAAIGLTKDHQVDLSTSGPFYALTFSDFYYAGYARRIRPNLVAAVSVNQLAVGPTTFKVDINSVDYELDKPTSTNLALSAAMEPIKGLHVGVNANLFRWDLFDDVPVANAFMLDAGVLYRKELGGRKSIQLGTSATNLTKGDITFASPVGDEATSEFPMIFRAGGAFFTGTEITIPGAGTGPLDLVFAIDFQDVLNNPFRTGFQVGTEAKVFNVFSLRLGYVNQSLDDGGFANNKDKLTDFTYGFDSTFRSMNSQNHVPFDLNLDYTSMKPAPVTYSGRRLDNFRTFSLQINWPLEN